MNAVPGRLTEVMVQQFGTQASRRYDCCLFSLSIYLVHPTHECHEGTSRNPAALFSTGKKTLVR